MNNNVYVIASGKGGAGKSTTAAYLGVELCKKGKKVLLIDMDEGLRSLDIMLNVSSHTLFDVSDIIKGNCNVNQAVIPVKQCPNLYLLPAPITVNSLNSPKGMRLLCDKLSVYFDYILIDSPAGVGKGFKNAIAGADNALVVVNPDAVSVRDGAYVAKLLRESRIKNIRLVINKLDKKLVKKSIFYNIDEIIDATTLQLIAVIPNDIELIKSFNNCGNSLYKSPATLAFERFAKRLNGQNIPLTDI
ncbi:MAG: septum site-determining protein MinD [Clostridia bacterium]|nr:septum site-determining protein MinD [Clostridia bacterium]